MNRLISGMALAAVLGSMAPLAAQAADTSTVVAPGASFEIIDKATGDVIGQLVSVGTNTQVIAAMADRARTTQQKIQIDQGANAVPKTPEQWQQFWTRNLPSVGGG